MGGGGDNEDVDVDEYDDNEDALKGYYNLQASGVTAPPKPAPRIRAGGIRGDVISGQSAVYVKEDTLHSSTSRNDSRFEVAPQQDQPTSSTNPFGDDDVADDAFSMPSMPPPPPPPPMP